MVLRRSKHEGVVGGSGGKPNVAGYALVGMNDGMNLDTSFLFARLGMAPNTFEKEIGEECNRGRVDDAQTLHPVLDRKSTRLNSSHANISYAVFCLKKKKYN